MKPEHRTKGELGFTILTILLAGASVNFFILGSLGIIPFITYRDAILIPSVIAIVAIGIYSRYKMKRLSNRLVTGLWTGAVASLALEAIRIPGYAVLHWLPGDDMIMMPGAFLNGLASSPMALMQMMHSGAMTSMPQSVMMAVMISGAIYHFWNGATMGAMYTLFVGKGRWYYGIVWGFIINIGMMLAPWLIMMFGPFGIKYMQGYNIFVVALIAHLAYGAVLGVLARRFVKEKGSIDAPRK
ncbi:MAG: hypothetical protein KGH87_08100 [Thaumarchaeota archaeon]|nr:hypothetical protein [Candidatus Nitrosotalea sp.]MDE1839865.1 hypothetical protein [Nitrososphaerota archaeon]